MARDRKSDAHRKVAEKHAGRKLTPDEVVDHIDQDKSNDSPSNLRVVGRAAHTAHHNRRSTRSVGKLVKALTMHKRGEKLY